MLRKNYLYWDNQQISNLINCGELSTSCKYLICIHSCIHTKNEAVLLAAWLKEMFPNSVTVGTSALDIIYLGKLYNDKCLISFISFEETDFDVNIFSFMNKSAEELAAEVYKTAYNDDTTLMFNFFSDKYSKAHAYIEKLNKLECKASIVGGLVSDAGFVNEDAYVFTDMGYYENSLLTVSFKNNKLMTSNHLITGHEPVGDFHTITKTENNSILEIDNIPAAKWMRELLGCKLFLNVNDNDYKPSDDVIMRFPLVFKGYKHSSRTLYYSGDGHKISQYHTDAIEGQEFRIAYLSRYVSATEWENACTALNDTPIESMFCYSCVLRKVWFEQCAEWELKPFSQGEVCGALLYGEIGNVDGKNEYLNGTCNLITVAEKRKYIVINNFMLRDIINTKDEFINYYYHVLENQNKRMYDKNIDLLDQISNQENMLINRMFIDSNTGIDNLSKLMYNNIHGKYCNGCLITVESGELAVSHFGVNSFGRIISDFVDKVQNLLDSKYQQLDGHIYIYDEYSFIIVSEKKDYSDLFIKFSEDLHSNFSSCNYDELNYSYANRFIVVVNEANMLDKIKLAKANARTLAKRYIKYDSALGLENAVEELMHITMVINYAIENDGVIPYFQPIFDNSTGKIDKFEALMRLLDNYGNIYYPGQFMEAAKIQGLYSQLSRIIINKVFDLFENRTESVSINLSAIDINSSETRAMIYERLERLGNAERFIFEVLESEELRELDVLKYFIDKVKRHNVRIAIDDFGAGFSNLLEIARLSPNYIKIDGQIVRDVVDSVINQKIVGTILHLAREFEIELIAEFIENQKLQDYASERGVRYSQGYFFSQAVPFEELDNVIALKRA